MNNNSAFSYKGLLLLILFTQLLIACSGGSESKDSDPELMVFKDEFDVALGAVVISEGVELEDIDDEVEVSVDAGEYSINGAKFTSEPGTVFEGDILYLRLQASEDIDTVTEMTVTVGDAEDVFSVRTQQSALVIRPAFKSLSFEWDVVQGASYYRLMNKPDANSEFEAIGRNIPASTTGLELEIPIHLIDWYNSEYKLEVCTTISCSYTEVVPAYNYMLRSIGYIKSANTEDFDRFATVKISADGSTLAVAAPGEDGGSKGLAGDIGNNAVSGSGAVYIYVKEDGVWNFQSYIKAPNTDASDAFGTSLGLSLDGNTLAVGAPFEDGANAGVDGNYNDNSLIDSGAVYIYKRIGTIWTLQNYLKSSNPSEEDGFGSSLALSAYGSTLVVGVANDDGVQDTPSVDTLIDSGAAYVFTLSGDNWQQTAYLKAPNSEAGDRFASAVSINAGGNLLVASTQYESSSASGVDASMASNDFANAGAVYTFRLSDNVWNFESYIKASNTQAGQSFGASVQVSPDGSSIAVGAPHEASIAIGVDGEQMDTSNPDSGAVYLFKYDGAAWRQHAYIKASNGDVGDVFGSTVALNWDGSILAVGALGESSVAEGVSGNEFDNSSLDSGAVYVYRDDSSGQWSQEKYLKAPNSDDADYFGASLSLDSSGNTLAVGAPGEQSSSNLFEGVQASNIHIEAGAVYLY